MRKKVSQGVAEAKMVKRYHRLHIPLVELLQSVQDLLPDGARLDGRVELTQADGYIDIAYSAKPVEVVINDGQKRFTLKVEEIAKPRPL